MTPAATSPIVLDPQQVEELQTDIAFQLAQLPTAITDDATYRKAKESLPLLKRAEDRVGGFFRDIKASAARTHKAICAKESEQLTPISRARQALSSLIYGYEREQDRLRRERERLAQEEAKRQADAEALEQAEQLVEQGAPEIADQVLEQAIATPAPVVALPSTSVDVAGVSIRENWKYAYVGASPGQEWKHLTSDQQARVMALLPREFCQPDESKIGRQVKISKSGTKIPGVQAFDAGTVAVRG